jgi:hypothetical protein
MRQALLVGLVIVCLLQACGMSQLLPAEPPGDGMMTSSLIIELSFEELVDYSDWIIVGTVTGQESKWNADRTNIHTLVAISVEEWVKGKPFTTSPDGKYFKNLLSCQKGDSVVITIPGGKVGDITQWVEDTPQFQTGEKVLLYLQSDSKGTIEVVGGIQGKFTIVNGNAVPSIPSSGSVPLAELISRIKAQLAK